MQANGTNGMVDPGHGQPRNGATVSTGPQDPPVPIDNNASRLSIKIRRTSTSASTGAGASEVPDRPAALANNGPTLNPMDLADGNAVAGPSRPMATSSIPAAPSGASTRKGVRPVFDYPRPTPEQLEDELPPLRHDQDVPLGLLLDRVVGKGYKGMRVLVEQTWVSSPMGFRFKGRSGGPEVRGRCRWVEVPSDACIEASARWLG
jgi:mediator of RNA polymerase II transcription subunit 14